MTLDGKAAAVAAAEAAAAGPGTGYEIIANCKSR